MSFLKISNGRTEDPDDKLSKARFLMEFMRRKCLKLFQPFQNVCIDERMVRNKGRYSFRQYIRDKPTKWGMKLWVLADSSTGYTYDFDVYLGKSTATSGFGLAYDVVMNLVKSIVNQGYHLFFDNFYTSVQLMRDLVGKGIRACGTIITNRKGFPPQLKNVKEFEKKSNRGDVRWVREGDILSMQWRDNKTVSFLSSIHHSNGFGFVHRRSKVNGQYRKLNVRQPKLVKDYNAHMGGVDKSDQLINKYNTLRKTNKWWKTLFYHFLDIARVNAFILFEDFRKKHRDVPELQRPNRYGQLDFTEELIRQLADLDDHADVPLASKKRVFATHPIIPVMTKETRNCKKCYKEKQKEQKTSVKCMGCETYLCFQKDRNCLLSFQEC